jgi:hypothetical protein
MVISEYRIDQRHVSPPVFFLILPLSPPVITLPFPSYNPCFGLTSLQVYPTQGPVCMHEYLLAGWGVPIGKFESAFFPIFLEPFMVLAVYRQLELTVD